MKLNYFNNRENSKIYTIIILSTLFVIFLGMDMYINAKNKIIELSNKNKVANSENIVKTFQFWLDERINSLIRFSKFIENTDILENNEKTNEFIKTFLQNSPEFDVVQLLKENGDLYVNGERIIKNIYQSKDKSGLIWHIETKSSNAPTINFIPKHGILKQETLNLCVPNYKNGHFAATLCGIVKVKSIFENINNFKLSPNSYTFIVTHSGEVLTSMHDNTLKEQIQNNFKELFLFDEDINGLVLDSNFISIAEIKSLNWFIGAGTDNKKESNELLQAISKNAFILLFAFIVLAFMANSLHNFMYTKIRRRKNEYEILLAHKTKMSEAGELISGINHQFIQPVNSLNLMVSTLLMLQREGKLDEKTLKDMLMSGEKSISLLNNTIEIFRNFYKTSENITNFSILQSVKNLLALMHTELSKANVSINLNEFEDKKVNQIENIIQQILLILIHNAKDALVDKFKDDIKSRKITIKTKFDDEKCYISVSEFGVGVSKQLSEKIFNMAKTTKKYGSGIGLYFAKKLANEKINGDLYLVNKSMPTVFELSFDINLRS